MDIGMPFRAYNFGTVIIVMQFLGKPDSTIIAIIFVCRHVVTPDLNRQPEMHISINSGCQWIDYLTFTLIDFGRTSSTFGKCSVRIPFS